MGWGDGCAQFGGGNVKTCLSVNCNSSDLVEVFLAQTEGTKLHLEITAGNSTIPVEFALGGIAKIDIPQRGYVSITCTGGMETLSGKYLVKHKKKALLPKEAFSGWLTPERVGDGWHGLEHGVMWGKAATKGIEYHAARFEANDDIDQGTGLRPDGGLKVFHTMCDLSSKGLVVSPNVKCEGGKAELKVIGEGDVKGERLFWYTSVVSNAPCYMQVECATCTTYQNRLAIYKTSLPVILHVGSGNGKNLLTVGKSTFTWEFTASPLSSAIKRVSREYNSFMNHGVAYTVQTGLQGGKCL